MKRIWFKRKLYGWGWIPVTWEGWLAVGAYVSLVILCSLSIDETSSMREIALSFVLPVAILTSALIRLCYRMGDKPKWQWGKGSED